MFVCSYRRFQVVNVLPKKKRKFRRVGGTHSGFPKARRGGLKHGSRPWLGMDIFWNCPL